MAKKKTSSGRRGPRRDFPSHTLEESLVIAKAIMTDGAGRPMDRILVAKSIGRTPSSSEFRLLLSSSIKYGLTEGSEKAEKILPLPRAHSIFKPTNEDERVRALRDAALEPEAFRRVLEHYKGNALPKDDFFANVLEREFGISQDHTEEFIRTLNANADHSQMLEDVSGKKYVMFDRSIDAAKDREQILTGDDESPEKEQSESVPNATHHETHAADEREASQAAPVTRVFISHGKNKTIVDNVKTMLDLADLKYEVAVESETTAIPVPEKIKEAMRRCNSAIICVTKDDGSDGHTINQNVLIEIGAAFVLYDQRVVLLWEKSLDIPSNLQGLYRCEIDDSELSWSAGMRLMAAIKKFKP